MTKLQLLKRVLPIALVLGLGACGGDDDAATDTPDPGGTSNAAPVIDGAPKTTAVVGEMYDFVPAASDADDDVLTFAIENRPTWAVFSPSSGRLSGRPPTSAEARTYVGIRISVSDSQAIAELPAFDLSVEASDGVPPPANTPPTISGEPATTATVGNSYAFTPDASDPDAQTLTFSITNRPSWASFDTASGELSGTPDDDDVATHSNIVISVSDGEASNSLPGFAITVSGGAPPPPVNRPPVIGGTPPSAATVGQAYSFRPTASDPDGQALSFSIDGMPGWASFNSGTGRLSGTPSAAGVHTGIQIRVTDGTATANLPAFTITVTAPPPPPVNRAPVITGTPVSSISVGQSYSFLPTATDADGDGLTFSVDNLPGWASFNAATGRITGTPQAADAGSHTGIAITVSDGALSDTLGPFTITVQQVQLGSATLSWTAPTQNEDGTPLTNLRGFRIYYGTSSTALGEMIEIPNAGISTAVVEDLAPATWFFAVRAYTTDGVESNSSNVASKRID